MSLFNRQKRDLTVAQQLARGPVDMPFLMLVVMLTIIGVIMVFSASYTTAINEGKSAYTYFIKQGIFVVLGYGAMAYVGRKDYQKFRLDSIFVMLLAFALMVIVLLPGCHTVRDDGVKRWLNMPGPIPDFQPSELAKLGVIMLFSASMAKRTSRKKRRYDTRTTWGRVRQFSENIGFTELIPYGVVLLIILVLMKLEKHMSGTILIMLPAAAILFAGGIKLGWLALGGGGVAALLALTIAGYQSARLDIWHDPWAHPSEGGYQIIQSLYAIGSGGLFGVGLGQSRQSKLFLPEPENDFIFSIVCEELGLVGAGLILLLFMMLIIRGYWISLHARDRFGSLLAVGVTTLIGAQVVLNICVVTNIIPTTGVSLPFFSYGGTALIVQLIEMGIVLSVSRQIPAQRQG